MTEPSATILKDCRHGRMLFLRNDVYIGRSLEVYGEYAEIEGQLFAQLVAAGQVVVEVGANIGAHTVHLARLVGPQGMVLAFEPQRVVFNLLCANLVLNEQFHVHAIHAAVGSAEGLVKVPALDPHARINFGGVGLQGAQSGDDVPLTVLDRYPVPSLRLLKIDVEGMEAEVLLGAQRTIAAHRPILYVENDRREHSARLIGLIQQLNYQLYWHLPPLFNPNNFAGHGEDVFGGVISINMLGLPAEMAASVTGFRPVTGPDDWWDRAS